MIIKKITTGFVIQSFDTELGEYTHQEFFAGDDVDYEDEDGNQANSMMLESADGSEPYLPFEMVQPEVIPNFLTETPTQLNGNFGVN